MSGRRPGPAGERGSGTVLALAVLGATCALLVGALAVGSAVLASHRARAAADLAALGAAVRLQAGDTAGACPRARAVAGANGAALSGCRPAADLSVVVEVEVPAPFLSRVVGHMAATARARAGPST